MHQREAAMCRRDYRYEQITDDPLTCFYTLERDTDYGRSNTGRGLTGASSLGKISDPQQEAVMVWEHQERSASRRLDSEGCDGVPTRRRPRQQQQQVRFCRDMLLQAFTEE